MADRTNPRWLLLIHQMPPDPAYLRVKIGRRLARVEALARQVRGKPSDEKRQTVEAEIARLEQRVVEIAKTDFFGASGREDVSAALRALRERVSPPPALAASELVAESYRGRTWVTRVGIHVDRIASAWLVRRFIDNDAAFKFVPAK
jgi:hypothetical protein